jgi:hypothetical protein
MVVHKKQNHMENLNTLTDVVNQMDWHYTHNGKANTTKLKSGVKHLNQCVFTNQEVQQAMDNCGNVDLGIDLEEIAKTIAPNLGADKLRADGIYNVCADENGSFQLR